MTAVPGVRDRHVPRQPRGVHRADQVGLPDRSPAYGEAWQATVARLDAAEALERSEIAEQIAADWARTTARSIDPNGALWSWIPGNGCRARVEALTAGVQYVPPPVDPQYRQAADYPRAVVANTSVVPAGTVDPWASQPAADTARFQTELAIAQQVAGNQVRAQQQADAEAAERVASAAVGQYIAPSRNAPARTPHR